MRKHSRETGRQDRAWFALTSASTNADDPVNTNVSDLQEGARHTGYCAGACHRARRKRDPAAGYDGVRNCIRRNCIGMYAFAVFKDAFAKTDGYAGQAPYDNRASSAPSGMTLPARLLP